MHFLILHVASEKKLLLEKINKLQRISRPVGL